VPRKEDVKTIRGLSEPDKAYLAGLLDGEGYIGITRSSVGKGPKGTKRGFAYRLHVSVHMTDLRPLLFAAEKTGLGQAKSRKKQKLSLRQSYVWNLWSNQAAQVLRALRPYFIVKAEQADLCLSFQDSVAWRGTPGLPDSEWDFKEQCWLKSKELSYGRKRKEADPSNFPR